MPKNIANRGQEEVVDREVIKKVLGRSTEAIRRLLDDGFDFNDLQKIIDSPRLRERFVAYVKADAPDTQINIICIGVNADTPLRYDRRKDGWELKRETKPKSGIVSLNLVKFPKEDEEIVSSQFIQKVGNRGLGQHYAEVLLDNQKLIPYALRGNTLIFSGHIWEEHGGYLPGLRVPCLQWDCTRWQLFFFAPAFDGRSSLLVC